MSTTKPQREYFLDSIRAGLMLLGVPFHVSLIYSSQQWAVNSAETSQWLTLFNEFIHTFRMQVFFVISGYFSYMLYLRYSPDQWLKVRLQRVAIPMLAAVPLITLPQFFLLKEGIKAFGDWESLSQYMQYNLLMWNLISHLWFLLELVIFTFLGMWLFRWLRQGKFLHFQHVGWWRITLALLGWMVLWCALRRVLLIVQPVLLSDGVFIITVTQMLQFLPLFMLGAFSWQYPSLKALFIRLNPWCCLAIPVLFWAQVANLQYSRGDGWLYEITAVLSTLVGICMLNLCYHFGHRLLNSHSPHVVYLVNASLFVYLIHHPLTLLYGFFITPLISSPTLGFLIGSTLVFALAFLLYEIHLRIPLLRFLFSGKVQSR